MPPPTNRPTWRSSPVSWIGLLVLAVVLWVSGGRWAEQHWDAGRTTWDNMRHWLPYLAIQTFRVVTALGCLVAAVVLMVIGFRRPEADDRPPT